MTGTNQILTYSFCEPYIDNLISFIDENYLKKGGDLTRLGIIFGGKRPALFVKQKLSKRLGRTFYSPSFFTIDEFMAYIIRKKENFTAVQDLDNSYLVYRLAQELTPDLLQGRESFAQFLPWAREILAFMDQLDLEKVSDNVLKNIEANAQIGYAVPEDINRLLQRIIVLRQACHQIFVEKKNYARGFQYYRASQIIDDVKFDEFDQIIFCNFFYFNRCEEVVAKKLNRQNKAALVFQGDQRKWPILNRISKSFQCSLLEGEEPEQTKFNLHLYSAFDAHSQIGQVREILKTIKNIDNTVVVLPNADLIVPLLSEITTLVKDFNISMGYPLQRSSLFTLFELIFKAQLSKKGHRYYTKDYLKVIR
ncbi:MAG: hypothetical protein KC733_07640, partial [Candidatus Omnitrophica bacterium]|nr:hypothetical protein [Candidatus Omnitrophota bacterium]